MIRYIIQVKELRQFVVTAKNRLEAKREASRRRHGFGACFGSEITDITEE